MGSARSIIAWTDAWMSIPWFLKVEACGGFGRAVVGRSV